MEAWAAANPAIAIALELHPDTLLIDERLGRRLAMKHGLPVTGLLGRAGTWQSSKGSSKRSSP